jgi:hypothetical protein
MISGYGHVFAESEGSFGVEVLAIFSPQVKLKKTGKITKWFIF